MKKILLTIPVLLIAGGLFFAGCSTPEEKAEKAENKVDDAKQDLNKAQLDAAAADKKAADVAAWNQFKAETELKIASNETRIADIKLQIKNSGKKASVAYTNKIDSLEMRNKNFKAKLAGYDNGQTNWESFKNEFGSDMDRLGEALKSFVVADKEK
jgi:outer membrane murein-binding lipoprotein Lpp